MPTRSRKAWWASGRQIWERPRQCPTREVRPPHRQRAAAAPAALGGASAGGGWSAPISAATIEDAIKSLKQQVDTEVTSLTDFKGKGHKLARRDYSVLAMLFAIAGEYDGEVRWKKTRRRPAMSLPAAPPISRSPPTRPTTKPKPAKQSWARLVGGSSPFSAKAAEARAA